LILLALWSLLEVLNFQRVPPTRLTKTKTETVRTIEKLESHLNSELNTLGYPKAALFGFCLALVAFNIYAIVMAQWFGQF